ncbi:unnamed protein product [Orchesella dallaii]|uniref:Uncharacterized protein n=1 Tax=Orchesella dallaii TaxID=48710 RepID=A0ABP1RKY2_9HEXA
MKGEPLKEIKFSKVVGNTNLKDLQAGSHPIFGVGQRGITLESFRQKLFDLMADARHAESHSKVRRTASLEGHGLETPRLFPPTKHVGRDQV